MRKQKKTKSRVLRKKIRYRENPFSIIAWTHRRLLNDINIIILFYFWVSLWINDDDVLLEFTTEKL